MSETLNRHWERAQTYLQQQRSDLADRELQSLQSQDPDGVATRLLAARIDWHRGRVREAAEQTLLAAEGAPDDPGTTADLIDTLRQVGETARAHEVFELADWNGIESTQLLYRFAILCQGFGKYERALAVLDQLLDLAPETATWWQFFRGQQFEFLGRFEEAVAAYETCLNQFPGFGYVAYKRVRLSQGTDANRLLRMIDSGLQYARPRTSDRADFEFAKYHVLENLGRTEEAWLTLVSANLSMRALQLANVDERQTGLRRICEYLSAQRISDSGKIPEGPRPIFIVGMPRTGTTLLEQMLANHSQVTGAGELNDFSSQLIQVSGRPDPIGDLPSFNIEELDFAELGRRYLAQTAWRAAGKAYFVDKMPANWMMVGLIHASLPHAKILHMTRDPMDTCFSIWRARFADGHAWSWNLATLAKHFVVYRDFMGHWKRALPNTLFDVNYAELVRRPAETLRRVMAFCDLPWEEGCEDPSRNSTPVPTLSSTQIREPIHTQNLERWRRYAGKLEPVRRILAETKGDRHE